jgi:hypothetical protein
MRTESEVTQEVGARVHEVKEAFILVEEKEPAQRDVETITPDPRRMSRDTRQNDDQDSGFEDDGSG